jgi:hypothetical protein
MQGWRFAAAPTLACLAAIAWAGCSSGHETGTVEGKFIAVGGMTNNSIPVSGTITVRSSDGHHTVLHVEKNTRFKTTVRAGKVSLIGRSQFFDSGRDDCQPDHPIVVKADTTARADVLCQMR